MRLCGSWSASLPTVALKGRQSLIWRYIYVLKNLQDLLESFDFIALRLIFLCKEFEII